MYISQNAKVMYIFFCVRTKYKDFEANSNINIIHENIDAERIRNESRLFICLISKYVVLIVITKLIVNFFCQHKHKCIAYDINETNLPEILNNSCITKTNCLHSYIYFSRIFHSHLPVSLT